MWQDVERKKERQNARFDQRYTLCCYREQLNCPSCVMPQKLATNVPLRVIFSDATNPALRITVASIQKGTGTVLGGWLG